MDEETIQKSIFTGRETLNELEKQNEILEFSETTLQEAEVISKQALYKVRGMTWWGSIINLFTFKTLDSKPRTKKVMNSQEEVHYDDKIDEMLDIALTMNKILKKNNDSIDRIEVKVEKLDDEFTSLKRRINDI
jgi:hypothetical protein